MEFASARALVAGVLLAEVVTRTYVFDLSAYPRWMIVAVGTLAVVLAIGILMKLLKWTLWLLLFAVLAIGLGTAAWLMFR